MPKVGSGKSTLIKFIIEAMKELGLEEDQVCYTAYTGKAAQVLLKKGNKNVMTLHKLLYESYPLPDGSFRRIPKLSLEYSVIILDEVSMAPKTLVDLLFSHRVYVICLGDPFQLPPIDKKEDNGLLEHPHIFLDEIMRQAQESEIIRLTMDIRAGNEIKEYDGEEIKILPYSELNEGMLSWADQVLCGTNHTRIALNNQMREMLGRSGSPQDGDKVICLRNYWDYFADNGDPLVNGTIGYLKNPFQSYNYLPNWFGGGRFAVTRSEFISDSDANFGPLQLDTKMILTGEKCCDIKTAYKLSKSVKTMHIVPMEFTYGYAITYWKAQGSEWDKVLVIEETFPRDIETHQRAIYTAITRATKKVVLIQK